MTFAVASPIVVALRFAFVRREQGLNRIGEVRAYCQHIYLAHALWDWGKDGKGGRADSKMDFLTHCDGVMEQLVGIGDEMARFLTLPNMSRGWNRTTRAGRREAQRSMEAAYLLLESVTIQRMTRLTVYAERLKAAGLSGSEISRIRQYERHIANHLEQLRLLKIYRTPQALWAFGRLFTIILPPFYAPTYAEVAREVKSLGLGIAFGVLTAVVFAALFESVQVLEDPFTAFISLDGIDVGEEFEFLNYNQLLKTRQLMFPAAPPYPVGTRLALSGKQYDPEVHFHSTPEERAQLMESGFQRKSDQKPKSTNRRKGLNKRESNWILQA